MLRIATIDNLSARAYTLLTPAFPADVMPCTPTEVYSRAARNLCDAALLPVARIRELGDRFEPLGTYGIACSGPVRSVVLFSKRPLERLLAEGRSVHVTKKSQTSRELLTLLCRDEFRLEPVLANNPDNVEARLLIGNEALDRTREELAWPYRRDLCAWWYEQTGFPFVFARWVIRHDVTLEERAMLNEWLEETVGCSEGAAGLNALAEGGLDLFDGEAGMDAARAYYTSLHARLNQLDLYGLSTFLRRQEAREEELWAKTA